ncbi:MAG: hypothetical protein U0931_39885 [Vulcanimicrobiota bacterium]
MNNVTFNQELEDRFIQLIQSSWDTYSQFEQASWIDDAMMGGVIAAHLQNGFFMLDCISDGSSHYARFVNDKKDRVVVRLMSKAGEDIVFARTLGNIAGLQLSFQRSYADVSKIVKAMKSELKSNLAGGKSSDFPDPGVFKIDAEGTTASCETSILVDLKDYVDPKSFLPDTQKIWTHCQAVYQSLEKYLVGVMA